ncbi:hypothetical protein BJ742DRAFT_906691 [Cladochytrium replicatum]|nr:hypothetical protein BJ742DRAFT_906691 [Cladochytrium replicatum]
MSTIRPPLSSTSRTVAGPLTGVPTSLRTSTVSQASSQAIAASHSGAVLSLSLTADASPTNFVPGPTSLSTSTNFPQSTSSAPSSTSTQASNTGSSGQNTNTIALSPIVIICFALALFSFLALIGHLSWRRYRSSPGRLQRKLRKYAVEDEIKRNNEIMERAPTIRRPASEFRGPITGYGHRRTVLGSDVADPEEMMAVWNDMKAATHVVGPNEGTRRFSTQSSWTMMFETLTRAAGTLGRKLSESTTRRPSTTSDVGMRKLSERASINSITKRRSSYLDGFDVKTRRETGGGLAAVGEDLVNGQQLLSKSTSEGIATNTLMSHGREPELRVVIGVVIGGGSNIAQSYVSSSSSGPSVFGTQSLSRVPPRNIDSKTTIAAPSPTYAANRIPFLFNDFAILPQSSPSVASDSLTYDSFLDSPSLGTSVASSAYSITGPKYNYNLPPQPKRRRPSLAHEQLRGTPSVPAKGHAMPPSQHAQVVQNSPALTVSSTVNNPSMSPAVVHSAVYPSGSNQRSNADNSVPIQLQPPPKAQIPPKEGRGW